MFRREAPEKLIVSVLFSARSAEEICINFSEMFYFLIFFYACQMFRREAPEKIDSFGRFRREAPGKLIVSSFGFVFGA